MANITTQKLGTGTGDVLSTGNSYITVIQEEIDIAKAVDDGLTSGDNITIMDLPKNTGMLYLDAVITEELSLGTSPQIDIGTTEADPDEYVDGQSDTSVGRFTSYVDAGYPLVITSDSTLYMQVAGSAPASGKVAVTLILVTPTDEAAKLATHRSYPNE